MIWHVALIIGETRDTTVNICSKKEEFQRWRCVYTAHLLKHKKSPFEHFPNTRRYTFFISYTPHAFDYWDFETSVTWPPEIDCHQNVPIYNILQFHTTLQIRIQENMMNWWTFCYVYIVYHFNFMNVLMFSGVDVEPNLSLSSLSQDPPFSTSSSCFPFDRRKRKNIVFSSSVKII